MHDVLSMVLSEDFLATIIRVGVPLMFASMSAYKMCIRDRADTVQNIGVETENRQGVIGGDIGKYARGGAACVDDDDVLRADQTGGKFSDPRFLLVAFLKLIQEVVFRMGCRGRGVARNRGSIAAQMFEVAPDRHFGDAEQVRKGLDGEHPL